MLFFLFSSLNVWANVITTVSDTISSDTIIVDIKPIDIVDSIPNSYLEQVDHYYNEWFSNVDTNNILYVDTAYIRALDKDKITLPDSVYQQRIDNIMSAVPLSYTSIVRSYIDTYLKKRTFQVASMLGASEYYFPIFEEAFDAECIPLEIKYLAVVESALNPTAFSRAGTGKMMGLNIDSYVDERRDPYLSSRAAAKYLKDLYGIYEDWILALAAYNCGPGNVNKAIRRSGGKRNYWDIYYYLPKETRGYVPAFIAVAYVFNYHKEHDIQYIKSALPVQVDTLMISDLLHLEQVANKMEIDLNALKRINPQYRTSVIPATDKKSYPLVLPRSMIGEFISNEDSIFAYNRSKYFDFSHRTADPLKRIKQSGSVVGTDGLTRIVYTVKPGDVPGGIAEKFRIRTVNLRYWNNLNSRMTIRVGQKLVLYVQPSVALTYNGVGTINSSKDRKPVPIDGDFTYYTVKSGDNLWEIAKKFPGVSNIDIMKWNGLSDSDVKRLKPGDKLKVKI